MTNKNHKYQKNRNLLRYLTINKFKEFPVYSLQKFLKENRITIINKKETVDEEFNNILILFKKGDGKGVIYFSHSKDHLLRTKIMFGKYNEKLVTRNLEEFFTLAKKIILGL